MNIKKALFAVLAFVGFSLPSFTYAATLSMSPAYASVTVGQTVTVQVLVTSADQAMNASSGVVSFPTDKLQVVSIGKTGSIVSFWIQEPSFSNTAGTVHFEGVIPNPGFTGSGGKLIGITFRAISEGTASVSYSTGSVLANDGQGTELLANSAGANIAIQAYVPPRVPPRAPPTVAPVSTTSAATSTITAPQVPPTTIEIPQFVTLGFPVSNGFIATSWLVINFLSVCMLVGLLVLAVFFTGRLIHKWWLVIAVRRRGHRYGTRLLAIHKELSEEVKLIESARELGELSRERKHLLDRLERACIELKEIASWWDA